MILSSKDLIRVCEEAAQILPTHIVIAHCCLSFLPKEMNRKKCREKDSLLSPFLNCELFKVHSDVVWSWFYANSEFYFHGIK